MKKYLIFSVEMYNKKGSLVRYEVVPSFEDANSLRAEWHNKFNLTSNGCIEIQPLLLVGEPQTI